MAMRKRQVMALLLTSALTVCQAGICFAENESMAEGGFPSAAGGTESVSVSEGVSGPAADTDATTSEEKAQIESALNLANNTDVTWSYDSSSDSWTMSIVTAVTNPEVEDEHGVSVNVPGAYVKGVDTDDDGETDVTSESYSEAVHGNLVLDHDASVTSENGQIYTASTAPCVITTGAAGYGEQTNQLASSTYAADGYISIACGNRGKTSTAENENGDAYYTGDAPDCLVDQKNAIRFVKYNILLGNLPGSADYFVSTGGSGGGAHAAMVAATSNNSDFYDYEIEAGAVGVYRGDDGTYSTTVTVDGTDYEISDGVWGCVAYSAITPLQEADMAMAFEYTLDTDYSFSTSFQKALASALSQEYMDYINSQNLTADESKTGFDLNGDGDAEDTVSLTIEYDESKYADTNGYGGTYLTYYLDEFEQNLQWYLDNLDYTDGWTWFDSDGNALSDEEVAAMTTEDKANAFIEGRYAKSQSDGMGGSGGMGGPGGIGGAPSGMGEAPSDMSEAPSGMGTPPDMTKSQDASSEAEGASYSTEGQVSPEAGQKQEIVGTPDAGTTQSASGSTDSANYSTYGEMLTAYENDIAEVESGDKYGNNIVELYDPLGYIGAESTENPTWTRVVMGASEGDMSMFASMNMQVAWQNAGTDSVIEWQWDGGHVPSEILGESLSLYIDEMYGKYVDGAVSVEKAAAEKQTENGTAEEATGTDLSAWVNYEDTSNISFSLADAASYRTAGASKATPGFDVIDYGQEDYEFGDWDSDARHWDKYVLKALQDHKEELSALYNGGSSD